MFVFEVAVLKIESRRGKQIFSRVFFFLNYFGCICINNAFACEIGFVSDKKFVDIVTSVSINFLQPLFNIVKCELISNVINNYNSMCSSIVGACDCFDFLQS